MAHQFSQGIALYQLPIGDFFDSLRQMIQEEIVKSQQKAFGERMLSTKEACKLFVPAVTQVTLHNWSKAGILKKHYVGRSVYYKASEVIEAAKVHQRYKRQAL
jgi:hypothetical protein